MCSILANRFFSGFNLFPTRQGGLCEREQISHVHRAGLYEVCNLRHLNSCFLISLIFFHFHVGMYVCIHTYIHIYIYMYIWKDVTNLDIW